jgi:hypothetical protein
MVSANTVAQKPAGSVIPPLSPAQADDDEAADDALAVLSVVVLPSDFTQPANPTAVAMAASDEVTIRLVT